MKIIIDEGKREVKLYITRSNLDSVVLTALFSWYKIKPKMEDIDEELRPLVADMLEHGYKTFNCCSGHRKVLGFIVFLPPGKRILRGASWEANEPIPESISELRGVLLFKSITLTGSDGGVKKWLEIKASIEALT